MSQLWMLGMMNELTSAITKPATKIPTGEPPRIPMSRSARASAGKPTAMVRRALRSALMPPRALPIVMPTPTTASSHGIAPADSPASSRPIWVRYV